MTIVGGGTNLKAGGTIAEFRCLKRSSTFPGVVHTTADTDVVVAVSTCAATSDNPGALKFSEMTPGTVVAITASAGISALAKVSPAADGKIATTATGDWVVGFAEEAAADDGDVIRVRIVPGYIDTDVS